VLAKQGRDLDAIPLAGEPVDLRGNANLSTGGTAEDVTDLLPQETRDICIRAARTIGLDVAGIDIVCQDISQPLREQRGGIIEVNAAPGIRMHQYPSRGTPRDDGRIPVIAVPGTGPLRQGRRAGVRLRFGYQRVAGGDPADVAGGGEAD
jgi:cyanophycin synthetase